MTTRCKICNKDYKRIITHITKEHGLTKEQYYIKYIDSTAGKCLVCGKPTKLKELYKGFNLYCSKKCSVTPYLKADSIKIINKSNPYTICPYCDNNFSNLSKHVQAKHKIIIKDYYDYFIDNYKTSNKKCPICKTEYLEFGSLSYGYYKTCSNKSCKQKYNILQASESNIINYVNIDSIEPKYDNKHNKLHLCVYCGKTYKKLSVHLKRAHKVRIEDYYLKYINPDAITECRVCGKPTKFGDIFYGFYETCGYSCNNKNRHKRYLDSNTDLPDSADYYADKVNKDEDYTKVCAICGKKYEALANHLKYSHNVSPETYYNKFISKPRKCIVCNKKDSKFNGLYAGYSYTCKNCTRGSMIGTFYLVEYGTILLRSSLEYVFYLLLVNYGIDFEYEKREHSISYVGLDGKMHMYIPDFYLPDYSTVVEVKPSNLHSDKIVLLKKYEYLRQRPYINYRILDPKDYQDFFSQLPDIKIN